MGKDKLQIYQETLEKGIKQRAAIEKTVKKIFKNKIENIFLVGCGGSLGCMYPLQYIMDINSELPVFTYNSSEFLALDPVSLGKNSLVILSSYSGQTKETVDTAKYVNRKGGITICFTGEDGSPLAQAVDYVFTNKADEGVTDSKIIMLYQIIFNVLKYTDDYQKYDEIMEVLDLLPEKLVEIKRKVEERAEKFAQANKNEEFFMTIGSGPNWGETYVYATCILEEMQWIHAQPVHAGEYFHGAFEIVREDTNLLIFKGEDKTRSLIDRVEEFSYKYSNNITLIDTKDYNNIVNISDEFKGYLSPLILSAVMDVFSKKLAEARNHSLETRKYMGKVDY